MDLIGGQEVLALEGSGDEIAGLSGQVADIADGARAGSLSGAEGLANQIGEVGFTGLAAGLGDLHEHGLHGGGNQIVLQD